MRFRIVINRDILKQIELIIASKKYEQTVEHAALIMTCLELEEIFEDRKEQANG